jgi:disease resistance protein RPM1
VGTNEKGEADVLDMLVSFTSPLPFPSLERLKLKGLLQEMPTWVGKCVSLVKIDLKYRELKELEALTELPNLMQLRLYDKAYSAEKLVFREKAFPELRILELIDSAALREVTFEEGTSPNMEKIRIQDCNLTSGINGIKHLPKLEEIYTVECTLVKQDVLPEEVDKHMNRPVLQMQFCEPASPEEETEVKVEVTESISEAGESLQL